MFFRKSRRRRRVFFQEDHNQVLKDIVPHFERVYNIREAERIVLWTDTTIDTQGIIDYAQRLKTKTIIVQHGRKGSARYYPPFNFPIQADKILVWGERDKKSLIESGHPEEKIVVTGTTLWDNFKDFKREKHDGINIVFSPEHWDRELSENKKIARILNLAARKHGWNITTKIIEGHDSKIYKNPISSSRSNPEHFNTIARVLSTADIVVGISESTFELISQHFDIPVVIVEEWIPKTFGGDERYFTYRRVISEASKKATYGTLEKIIKEQLENPRELEPERAIVASEEGGVLIDNPLQKIIEEIKK